MRQRNEQQFRFDRQALAGHRFTIDRSLRSRSGVMLLLVFLVLTLGNCSNRSRYEILRQNRLQACEEIPVPQQAQCKAQYQMDYETYRREREAIR